MTIQLVVTNEKGLFAHGQNLVLVTHENMTRIQALLNTHPDDEVLKWGYDILCAFPHLQGRMATSLKNWQQRDHFSGVGFWHATQFSSKNSNTTLSLTGTQDGFGWTALRRFYENKAYLRRLIPFLEQHKIFLYPLIEGTTLGNFAKRSQTLQIEEQDTWKKLGQSECILVFGKTRHSKWMPMQEGYLDSRGMFGELRGARLFESVGAAERTIASSSSLNLECYVLIHAAVQIQSIHDNNFQHIDQMPQLQEAIALLEKQRLREALEKANEEELQAQLAKLREKKQSEETPKKGRL